MRTMTQFPNSASPASSARTWLGLLAWLALCFVVAAVSSVPSREAPVFYAQLSLPAWAPPAGLFGPVWTVLYAMMGIAAWMVWRARGWSGAGAPLGLFVAQLVVNGLWSWLFFGWRLGALAFADVVLMVLLVLATLVGFWRVRRAAGLLLVPYLAWISFATALTWAAWQRNPQLL